MGRLFSLCATHRLEPSTLHWLEQPVIAGGGVIFHTAVHLFDALRFITGEEIVKIRALARNIYNPGLEDLVIAEAVLSNGALAIVDTSKVSHSRACRYEFVCEKGQLHGDQVHGILQKIEGSTISGLPVKSPGPALLPLLEDWYAYLHGNGKNPIPGTEGLAAVKICHACRESVANGQWVDIEEL
jgi:predicted dehydrogenase